MEKKIFIGIDLGGKEKKTTGICILKEKGKKLGFLGDYCSVCQDIKGKDFFETIKPYLEKTKVIAIDAPLTKGRGKGKMRLYEKFLSTKIFRQDKVSPLPPALMPSLCSFAKEVVRKLEKQGFVLDLNLIETFSTFVQEVIKKDFVASLFEKIEVPCKTKNQQSALVSAVVAYLHFHFKTRYLGYKDGFLFLPQMSLWKSQWCEKFSQAWKEKSFLKYRYLITNLFD